jgi:16S rRNA (uracil1498-N3)-methyltransferase
LEYKQIWRFYSDRISEYKESSKTLDLSSDEAHFAHSVLRLGQGERVEIADGCGWVAQARLTRSDKKLVCAEVENVHFFPKARQKVIALVGVTKPGAMDEIVQACVESGVSELIFYRADRTTSKQELKLDKIAKQVRELSRITKSPWLLNVTFRENLQSAFGYANEIAPRVRLFVCDERPAHSAVESSSARHLLIESLNEPINDLAFVVGPESSFSQKEYEFFLSEETKHSACFVTLGPRILRTPAAVAAAAYMLLGLIESGLHHSEFRK